MLESIFNEKFEQIKTDLSQYPRSHGYYRFEFVSIQSLRKEKLSQEEILEAIFQLWTDHELIQSNQAKFPSLLSLTSAQLPRWEEHEVTLQDGLDGFIQELQGSSSIGHTTDTIPPGSARALAEDFASLFHQPRCYRGLGICDPQYVFEHGLALVDAVRAGAILIVEDD